ncbi:T9SS type B sorting domain-containing protein [Flavobacterium acetivorans]|uniref:T9SS type B sorting domain-containing protein n=1 Tax=Flavobacterium acetivorans TaxID=2893883 RepID=UPI001E4EE44F|nr:T9SS type B sorting domain-containing protein [Flavobacterium sp. F-29]UFH34109.1 T9SS type B sorting domain-containing protein [Flavobacterium sp. F-29]
MKCIKIILFWILVLCNTTLVFAQAISVDDSKNATDLTQILTNNSSCISISGESVKGDIFTPGQNSYGYFNNQGGSFPFTEGIVLSTWSSKNSEGPFMRNQGGGSNLWLGDPDLDQTLDIRSTNATVLEFDFIPLTNFISFNYLFASNEYQDDFPCRLSDAFVFLIKEKGSTGNYQNLAVLPGTTTPVSSTNIRPLINFTDNFGTQKGCPAINQTYFEQLNTSPTNTSPINYAGQTVVMNAQTTVIPGKTYHIKLVVADDGTKDFDSAIFIEAGSFTSKIDLGPDRIAPNNTICFGESFIIDTKLSPGYAYKWYKDNSLTPIAGETNPSYQATETGTYRVEVELGSTNCIASGEIKVEFTPEIVLQDTNLIQCDDNGDGIAIFDLTRAEPILKNNNSNLGTMVFYENTVDAQNNLNPIQNPKNYNNKANNQILIAKILDSYRCAHYAQLTLGISNQTITPLAPIVVCDDDGTDDGIYQFDLVSIATLSAFSGLGNNISVGFYLNQNDAYLERNALPTIFRNTIPYRQTIYAGVLNGSDCYGITPVSLVVNSFYPPNFQQENIALCANSNLNISVNAGFLSYLWNTGETTNEINISNPGNYSVKVTSANGCEATKKFTIIASEIASIKNVQVNDFAGNQNSALIEYTGTGDYEFSIDGSYFQDSPLFNGIAAGTYWAYARDKNGCGNAAPFQFYVLDYPRFFTPNGDGFNDLWIIKNLDLFPKATITIFDRYGKLLKQLSPSSLGWDGTFNGYKLPSDDYWFSINFAEGKSIKGHFSLKR